MDAERMKITQKQLRRIIKEEISRLVERSPEAQRRLNDRLHGPDNEYGDESPADYRARKAQRTRNERQADYYGRENPYGDESPADYRARKASETRRARAKAALKAAAESEEGLSESNMSGITAELTDPDVTEEQVSAAWPEGVMVDGVNVYQVFYEGPGVGEAWQYLQRSGYSEGQESYLGYSPSSGTFYMGFDAWEDYEDEYGGIQPGDEMSGVVMELGDNGTAIDIVVEMPGSMYPAGLRELKRMVPDIIDVRLD
ncbi:MAG: hypothetical protein CME70_19225 [Halobacteriovorax sp.]|nr:hypothetical protein [Halobacteriovorax sp.]